MSTSKELPLANMSRKRMKETRPRTKRTPSQLAHLEELVEGKKPGSLSGSFSVFEVERPVPPKKAVQQAVKHVSPKPLTAQPISTTSMKHQSPPIIPKFVKSRRASITSIPNISRNRLQSLLQMQPSTDLRHNTIAGVLNSVDAPLQSTYFKVEDQSSNRSVSPSYSYVAENSQQHVLTNQASLLTRPRLTSCSPSADSYTSIASSSSSRAPSYYNTPPNNQKSDVQYPIVDDFWSWSSDFMLKGPKGAELARLEDCLSEDILVRAIMSGWDSIGESWELPPFWRIIRQLDENLFRLFGPIERMASFKVIHTLLKFHSDPTAERAATLPHFYQSKGVDFEGDYYIGNFLPWPGIRNMTKSPLHPCRSNKWFQAQLRTLKILWPHRLEDAFTRNPETGLFKLTDDFNKRSYDINCWTFGPEMFEEFPIVFGSAPSRGTIPGAIGYLGSRGALVDRKTVVRGCVEYTDADVEEMDDDGATMSVRNTNTANSLVQNEITAMMETSPLNYDNLNWKEEQKDGKRVVYFTLW